MKNNLWSFITPVSFVLFLGSLYLINKDIIFVIIVTVSIVVHELAHGLALNRYGHRFHLAFIPFVGAGVIPSNKEKFFATPDDHKAIIALAGPLSNSLIALVSVAWLKFIPAAPNELMDIIIINVLLFVLNIVPIGPFDGSRVASTIIRATQTQNIKYALAAYFIFFSSLTFIGLEATKHEGEILLLSSIFPVAMSIIGVIWKLMPHKSEYLSRIYNDNIPKLTPKTRVGITAVYFAMSLVPIYFFYREFIVLR